VVVGINEGEDRGRGRDGKGKETLEKVESGGLERKGMTCRENGLLGRKTTSKKISNEKSSKKRREKREIMQRDRQGGKGGRSTEHPLGGSLPKTSKKRKESKSGKKVEKDVKKA